MRTALLTAALAGVLAACGQGAAALTVPQALETEGQLVVEGYVFAGSGGLRLCEAVAESFPPQCGGASLAVEGADADDFSDLRREGGEAWSDTQRRVGGTVRGDTISVTDPDS